MRPTQKGSFLEKFCEVLPRLIHGLAAGGLHVASGFGGRCKVLDFLLVFSWHPTRLCGAEHSFVWYNA